jgi:hypothetical protein
VAAVPTDADTLAFAPFRHSGAQFIHNACDFMPWNAGVGDSWPRAFDDKRIAVANTTCLHFNANLPWTGLGNRSLDDLKTGSASGYLGRFHGRYCDCCCHKSSCSCCD